MEATSTRFLIDTSIWLEFLLDQERAEEAEAMFKAVPLARFALTEFSLYSIGLGLTRQGEDFLVFLRRNFLDRSLRRIRLRGGELLRLPEAMNEFRLDFDDAYQYVAATSRELDLVSFDTDFDRTDIERLEPTEVLDEFE
ncbi:MAG: VapC toxin family PIN domain ribonuclease [Bacteroidetes bacterium QH_9_64_21]|nr:MAG: VapC toxin family PIN domain ribonuclease [Bacteroidetes bacterium QH_9_64_21]